MGSVNFSVDTGLIKAIRTSLPLDVFVETGTFEGESVLSLRDYFEEIYTTELSKEYFELCGKKFAGIDKIKLYNYDSPEFLRKIRKSVDKKSVLYWLDAHWCVADKTAGEKSQCPLLNELEAIKSLNEKCVIIIDDARLFLAPPPSPHEISQWPDFNSVISSLEQLSDGHEMMILNDTIIFYPKAIRAKIRDYAYTNSVDWLDVMHRTRDYDNLRNQFDGLRAKFGELQAQFGNLLTQVLEKDNTIKKLSIDLVEKEKELNSLAEGFNILKKRLSSPVWGIITLFQHQFPAIWNYMYELREKRNKKEAEIKKSNSLGFFTPRLGKLYHHPPVEMAVPESYFKTVLESQPLKISVITPSFNQAGFIRKTVESVVTQNYEHCEYLIQDSCSTDGTGEILNLINHENIEIYIEKDSGQANAINRGFSKSSGDLMAWLNSDDIYLPGTFNYVVNFFNANPNVDVIYGHRVLIDENDFEIGRWILPRHDGEVNYYADFIPQETLFWRRSIWEKAGGSLDEKFNFALDWDLLLRFQQAGANIVRAPRFLAAFRVHPQQKTSAQISTLGNTEMNVLRKKYLGRDVEYEEVKKKIANYLLKSEILNKLYKIKMVSY